MRFYKITFILLAGMLVSCATQRKSIPRDYDVTPVLLHSSAAKQHDTIGFNLVTSLAELLYPRILTGDIPLWENSDKRLVVGATQFQNLEKKAKNPFVTGNDLFIHQYWQIFKRNFNFSIQGFSFAALDKNGNTINYGFIDGPDVISLLKSKNIPTNANGVAELSFWDALHTMKYQFNLVQFGENNFKTNPKLSSALQYQAIYDPKIYRDLHSAKVAKRLSYKVLPPNINSNPENKAIYTAIETAVNNNKQAILNAGGDQFFSHIAFKPWKVSTLVVEEKWEQYKSIPLQSITNVQLFIDGHRIVLTSAQLEEMNIKVNMQGLEEYLSEKRFDFLLETINDQEIQPKQSSKLYQALIAKPWDRIDN